MSDFHAIGGVSATLQILLKERMELPMGVSNLALQVTVSSPRSEQQNGAAAEDPRVNLFLYRVMENGSLKNQDILGHGHPGAYGRPPLSLNLHYLLTAYGTKEQGEFVNEIQAQHLLGSAMRVLHDHAIITEQTLTITGQVGEPILDVSLRDQFEQVKICLDPLNLEDLSKVWTALSLPYRLSAAYTVSVVQIESRRQRRTAIPVKTRRLHVAPLRRPQITALYRTPAPGAPVGDLRVRIDDPITIEGLNFTAPKTWVKVGNLNPILVVPISDEKIVVVPDDPLLEPGPQVVEVQTQQATEVVQGGLDKGQVVLDQAIQHSNQTVFMLVPTITPPITTTANFGLLTIEGKRLFREGLKSFVLIGDLTIEVRPPVQQEPWAPPTATLVQVPLPPLPSGSQHLVRVKVNGAESTEEPMLVVP